MTELPLSLEEVLPAPSERVIPIMVLSDGTTFSELSGCRMMMVPDNWNTEETETALAEGHPAITIMGWF
jgi:hypothetical protein